MRKIVMVFMCVVLATTSGCGLEILSGIAVYEAARRAIREQQEHQRKGTEEKTDTGVAETQTPAESEKEQDPRAPRANCIRVESGWQCK